MAHDGGRPPPPNSHGDCAGLDGSPAAGGKDRRGMYDWLLGTAVASWPHARRLRRDWAGMFLRGLNWLGPPGGSMGGLWMLWRFFADNLLSELTLLKLAS